MTLHNKLKMWLLLSNQQKVQREAFPLSKRINIRLFEVITGFSLAHTKSGFARGLLSGTSGVKM